MTGSNSLGGGEALKGRIEGHSSPRFSRGGCGAEVDSSRTCCYGVALCAYRRSTLRTFVLLVPCAHCVACLLLRRLTVG